MKMEEEKGYEIIDKRGTRGTDTQAESQSKSESASENESFNLPPVDVYSLIGSFIGMLGMQAWQWIGLVKNPSTGNIEKDLPQAKVAIDAIAALAKQLEGKMDASEEKELRELISNLQLNYVQQSNKS